MPVLPGSPRYVCLRKVHGQEEAEHWPPAVKPLERPDNKVCTGVRLYPADAQWRAECDEAEPTMEGEPHLLLTRSTVLGLLHDAKRGKAEAELLGVRVVKASGKGSDPATHLVVAALPGSGLGPRRPVVAPIEALVLSEYVERGARAEAQLDLRLTPTEFTALPPFLPDETILRLVNATLAQEAVVQNAYSYSEHRHSDVMAEVEAGRVSLYGRADLASAGEQAIAALEATPGVVEVADYLLYLEDLQAKVEEALAAKGLDGIIVLSEHALIILRGEVPDAKTRYQAEDIAKSVPGVRGVVNDIVVSAQA
jgi:hypothetical protein